jgi:hypothetical protein
MAPAEDPFLFPRLRVVTYSPPEAHVEPILCFLRKVIELAEPSGLPIATSCNFSPRETRFTEQNWTRFAKRVRAGKVYSYAIVQFLCEGMTMNSPGPADGILPLTVLGQFVPAAGVPKDSANLTHRTIRMYGIRRYPSSVTLQMDLDMHEAPAIVEMPERVRSLACELFTQLALASGCVAKCRLHGASLPLSPHFIKPASLVEELDVRLPGLDWGMFLGPRHITGLGGKDRLFEALAGCRVDDLSTETAERVYVQLTESIEDFSEEVADRYRPFFEPLLPED